MKLPGRQTLTGLLIALGLALAGPTASAQKERPNPANIAAIAAGKEAIQSYEDEVATVRTAIAAAEAAGAQVPARKVYAAWLEAEIALAKQSFEDAHPKAAPVLEARTAEGNAALEAARAHKDSQRTELSAVLSNTPLDVRADARPLLEAVLAAELAQLNVAEQLAADFDSVAQSLREGTEPYALFNARKPMREQSAAAFQKAIADMAAASEKLKALLPPA